MQRSVQRPASTSLPDTATAGRAEPWLSGAVPEVAAASVEAPGAPVLKVVCGNMLLSSNHLVSIVQHDDLHGFHNRNLGGVGSACSVHSLQSRAAMPAASISPTVSRIRPHQTSWDDPLALSKISSDQCEGTAAAGRCEVANGTPKRCNKDPFRRVDLTQC